MPTRPIVLTGVLHPHGGTVSVHQCGPGLRVRLILAYLRVGCISKERHTSVDPASQKGKPLHTYGWLHIPSKAHKRGPGLTARLYPVCLRLTASSKEGPPVWTTHLAATLFPALLSALHYTQIVSRRVLHLCVPEF